MNQEKDVVSHAEPGGTDTSDLFEKYGEIIPRGNVLFYEGDNGQQMYIIQSGKIRISKRVRNVEKTLVILGKGEFFGEMAILNNRPRSATATIVEDSKLLIIDRRTFETMIRNNSEIAIRIIKKLAARLQQADNQIENLLLKDNLSRMVNFLRRWAMEKGAPAAGEFSFAYLREDLAEGAGISVELFDEMLKKLSTANMIHLSDGRITILNMEGLERFTRYLEMKDQFKDLT
ncbi:MAG: Crp/Fnr family transcriptional regulator [bacterium]